MANWRKVNEDDLAATLSQGEIDAFRRDGGLDGSDPVERLLESTVALVRNFCSMSGAVRLGPAGTLPCGLVIPAMDYAAAKVLNRLNTPLSEDRRKALERAEAIFDNIAKGLYTPESYTEDGEVDGADRPATSPAYAPATPERLLD